MPNFNEQVIESFSAAGLDVGELKKAQRVAWVRSLWKSLVEEAILEHTNGVYIFNKTGRKEMHIYLDDSMYASEISNRKALIYQECRLKYNEPIDDVYVHVSQGARKHQYPFIAPTNHSIDQNDPIPLSDQELAQVEEVCENIPDPHLRKQFKQALIADLEWKKGNK